MKIITWMCLLILAFSFEIIAQTLTPEERDQIISMLQSNSTDTLLFAAGEVETYGIAEALPILEDRLWDIDPRLQIWFLRALWKLGSESTLSLTLAFIDSLGKYTERGIGINMLWEKVAATEILIDYDDFSTIPSVFELIGRDSTNPPQIAQDLLSKIILHVPTYAAHAKAELTRLAVEGNSPMTRGLAVADLLELYGLEDPELLVHMAISDSTETNRWYAINKLIDLEYAEIKPFLYDRLINEEFAGYRRLIADTLLIRYGTLEDYRQVQLYVEFESDTTRKLLANLALQSFTPPVPPASMSPLAMLDTLISYKHQAFAFGWIMEEGIVTSLDSKLDAARPQIINDRPSAIQILQSFINEVEALNTQGNQITREAYVFLKQYAEYLIARL